MISLFLFTALLCFLLIGALFVSILTPGARVWPPPAQKSWQFVVVWSLTILAFGCFALLGILDWNSLAWPATLRWSLGPGLLVAGNALGWISVRQLGMRTTSGGTGKLVTSGLYQYSRNPAYVGDILILIGWAVLSASVWTIPAATLGVVAFVLAPFAEEPWLEEIHGDAYRRYRQKTPRFLL